MMQKAESLLFLTINHKFKIDLRAIFIRKIPTFP